MTETADPDQVRRLALAKCQEALPQWQGRGLDDFTFAAPKGFSSFTMAIEAIGSLEPRAVFYRHLGDKENAILDFATERDVFLLLGQHHIAAECLHYDDTCRIEAFYPGRTLTPTDLFLPEVQRGIANELYRFHQLEPDNLPDRTFFELLHQQWGQMARTVLGDQRHVFPDDEQELCEDLTAIYSDDTLERVLRCLPEEEPRFCHNDTYHGNVMLLDTGEIKLLDFEFSCRNHISFDFSNLFAETVMVHGLTEPPHFRIAEPEFGEAELRSLIGFYLDNDAQLTSTRRRQELDRLTEQTRRMLMLSDFMYAMAALPLSVEPIQRVRFIPYAHQRFAKFLRTWEREFDST